MEQQSPLENFFHSGSKLIIFVPIVIVMVAFVLRDSSRGTTASSRNRYSSLLSITPVRTSPTPDTSNPADRLAFGSGQTKLNLTGPLVCDYKSTDLNATVSIKNKQVFAELANEYVLVRDDCVYRWNKGSITGEKSCGGITSLMGMAESLAGFGLMDMQTILSTISQFGVGTSITPPPLDTLEDSCVEKPIGDIVFSLPQGVTFRQETPVSPTP